MADILVTSPYRPFTLPNQFKAVFNGYIYCGTVDAVDPSVSQVQVYLANEDGSRIQVAQPLRTNAGGFLVYNGQPAKFVTNSNHSLLVRDYLGALVWYEPNMANIDPAAATEAATEAAISGVLDLLDNPNGSSLVNFTQAGTGAITRTSEKKMRDFVSVMDFGAIGDGIADDTAAIQSAHDAHQIVHYPAGKYKSGPIILKKFGATLIGSGELYGASEIIYSGSGKLFTCTTDASYVQFKSGMYLHGTPAVSTDYYNTGSIAVDITAGNTSVIFDGSWVNGFEILFNSNYNSYYNRFTGNRFERFRVGLNKFSTNNLHISNNRVSRFNTAIFANGANGPIVIDKNSFEVFNGPIASMAGIEQGEVVFTNNYVELYDSVDLPTNFPASAAPNTAKFGGNTLFTGPFGSFICKGNELQIGGCFRLFSASLNVDWIESEGNNIHVYASGNNIDRMWAAPSVGGCRINDRVGLTQGANGGYGRAYSTPFLGQQNPNEPFYYFDCLANKSIRATVEASTLTMQNSWTSTDANAGIAKVLKKDGRTTLSGLIDGSARTAVTAFTIPLTHRPDEIGTTKLYSYFTCFSAYGGGSIVLFRYIYSSGEMRVEGSPSSLENIPLDGIEIPVRT